jgi:hypothetical protein
VRSGDQGKGPNPNMEQNLHRQQHYTSSALEPWEVVELWAEELQWDRRISYHLGATIKYIARHQLKGSPVSDLRKAAVYLSRAADVLEGKT